MKPVFFLVAVQTIDGKIARDSRHLTDWSSKEDKEFLHSLLGRCDAVVVGRNTYNVAKKPLSSRNCIVFTRRAQKPIRESKNLVLIDPGKTDVKKFVREQGYGKIAVLGGTKTFTFFLDKGLADELWLTIEPLVFGAGLSLFSSAFSMNRFRLVSSRRLNRNGAILLHYLKKKME